VSGGQCSQWLIASRGLVCVATPPLADSGTIAAGQQSDHLVMASALQQWLAAARGPKGRKVFLLTLSLTTVDNCVCNEHPQCQFRCRMRNCAVSVS